MRHAAGSVATAAALVAGYWWLPPSGAVARWVLGLGLVALVLVAQLRAIRRSRRPVRRGVRALVLIVALFVMVFANTYRLLSDADPGAFTEPLDRTDALYFTVTVLATVGFGDIVPRTPAARVLVTCQMVGDVLLVGGAARLVVTAVRERRRQVDR